MLTITLIYTLQLAHSMPWAAHMMPLLQGGLILFQP